MEKTERTEQLEQAVLTVFDKYPDDIALQLSMLLYMVVVELGTLDPDQIHPIQCEAYAYLKNNSAKFTIDQKGPRSFVTRKVVIHAGE